MIETLNDVFDVAPTVRAEPTGVSVSDTHEVVVVPEMTDEEADTALARATLRDLIHKGTGALDTLLRLSENSEHPRAYEVAAQMLKNMSDISKDLMSVHKNKGKKAPAKIGTQNVFVGTTSELFKAIGREQIQIAEAEIVDIT